MLCGHDRRRAPTAWPGTDAVRDPSARPDRPPGRADDPLDAHARLNDPIGVDTDIPLLAAERWLAGETPYLPLAFDESAGRGLPFLYPPHVLPILAPLSVVPRDIVIAVAVVVWAIVAALGVRRLGIAWPFVPAILLWPPLAEAIIGTNAEIVAFTAFVFVLVPSSTLDERRRPAIVDALLVAATCVAKVSQVHALANVVARRPGAGLIALGLPLGLAVVTLPVVGLPCGRSGSSTWSGQVTHCGAPSVRRSRPLSRAWWPWA